MASHHIVPVKALIGTFAALLALTAITVLVTFIDLGPGLNLALALGIAGIKATLVLSVFMALRWDSGYNVLIVLSSFLFIALFAVFIIADFAFRDSIDPVEMQTFGLESPVKPVTDGYNSH
ncbi:MAG: cytochrome C oxidase subunit IV family protein [Candidatus Marinamargulisbacteria bacterium]|jgi:cytochrome c oxidase subunit IV|nr:cytochrome C oxidase subunit IV family protein [Candidatus Marinamargulisbacteria bacterium]